MQIPAYKAARRRGWKAIGVDGNPRAQYRGEADLFLPIDLKDRIGLAEAAAELKERENLQGVFTCGTDFSASVAWVAQKLGFPGIPYQTALDCTDKYRMRQRLVEKGIPCPAFVELSQEMDFEEAVEPLRYPLVAKPVDNMGGRGVLTISSPPELSEAVLGAIAQSRTERAIVEEFMDGPEFSIDSLVYDGEIHITGFADRHIHYPPYFIEMGHTLPSRVEGPQREEIFKGFKGAVEALGITLGAAKGDIKLSSQGVMIGEIAARLSGGYMSGWTYPHATGVPLVEAAMELALGLRPKNLKAQKDLVSSERAFVSIPGRLRNVRGLEEAHNLKGVKEVFLLVQEGQDLDFPRNNVTKCGNIIATGQTREEAESQSAQGVQKIRLDLEPGDERTRLFLESPLNTPFPPSAYRGDLWKKLPPLADFSLDFKAQYSPGALPLPSKREEDFLRQQDWNGLTLGEALEELSPKAGEEWGPYALHFWYALLRGGVQGARWFMEFQGRESS